MTKENGKPIRWREYRLMIPATMAGHIDAALDDQSRMENRAIDNSEFFCWLLGLGLSAREQLKAADEKGHRRVILPGEPE